MKPLQLRAGTMVLFLVITCLLSCFFSENTNNLSVSAMELRSTLVPHRATVHPSSAMLSLRASIPLEEMVASGNISHTLLLPSPTSYYPSPLPPGISASTGNLKRIDENNKTMESSSLQVGFSQEDYPFITVQRFEWTTTKTYPESEEEVENLNKQLKAIGNQLTDGELSLRQLQGLDGDLEAFGSALIQKDMIANLLKAGTGGGGGGKVAAGEEKSSNAGGGGGGVEVNHVRDLLQTIPTTVEQTRRERTLLIEKTREKRILIEELKKNRTKSQDRLKELAKTEDCIKVHLQLDLEVYELWKAKQEKLMTEQQQHDHDADQGSDGAAMNTSVAELWATTVITSAHWKPSYEFKFNTSDNTVTVQYSAQVYQQTRLDWDGIQLELCTAEPTFGRKAPTLGDWNVFLHDYEEGADVHQRLDFAQKEDFNSYQGRKKGSRDNKYQQKYIQRMKKSNMMNNIEQVQVASAPAGGSAIETELYSVVDDGAISDEVEMEEEEDDDDLLEAAVARARLQDLSNVVSSGISDIFTLSNKHSMPKLQEVRLPITSVRLSANISYLAVPKLSTKVFIRAKVANQSPFTLLPGAALLFADGNFISSTTIPLVATGSSTSLDVGVEPRMVVKRKLLSKNTTVSGSFLSAKSTIKDIRYGLVIQSKRNDNVKVIVKDALPRVLPGSQRVGKKEEAKMLLVEPKGLLDKDTPIQAGQKDKTIRGEEARNSSPVSSSGEYRDGETLVYAADTEEITYTGSNNQLRWVIEAPAAKTVQVAYQVAAHFPEELYLHGLEKGN